MTHLEFKRLKKSGLLKLQLIILFLAGSFSAFAESNNHLIPGIDDVMQHSSRKIKGRVVDTQGEPIPGATVVVEGTQNGTSVSMEGGFELTVTNPANAKLVVSFIGMETVVQKVGDKSDFLIIMKEGGLELEEVQVVAFGVQKKESVVGAISTVKPNALEVPARSLSQTLAGRVAGLISVQTSGEPGKDDAQFWIRGIATFTGSSNPLVLVDGIERPLSNVDPLEIESFSVLKDASATAVYGVRGANGVILITTRKGFDGKAKIDARYEHGFSFATKRLKFLDGYSQALLYNEAVKGTDKYATAFSNDQLDAIRTGSDLELFPDVDWQDFMMKDFTMNEKLSVNISGGGRSARYFTAVSVYNQGGQYGLNKGAYDWVDSGMGKFGKNINYIRYNFRSNVDMDITTTTTVSLGLWGNVAVNSEPASGTDAIYGAIISTKPYAFPPLFRDGKYSQRPNLSNPYLLLSKGGYKETTSNDLRANLSVTQKLDFLLKGLNANVKYAYDAVNYNDASRTRTYAYYSPVGRDDEGNLITTPYEVASEIDYLNYASGAWGSKKQYFEASLNYDGKFKKHEVGALALMFLEDYRDNTASNYISSLPNRSLGFSGRITYAYDSRYMLELNAGYTGSENFPKDKRMGFFPAVAIGWNASNEAFLKDNKVLTKLKLRASAGQVGNDNIPSTRFAYLSTVNTADGYSLYGQSYNTYKAGLQEGQIGVEDITWERATKYDVGVEVGLWNDLKIEADVFYERRKNIFLQPQVSIVAGLLSKPYANMGTMDNKGFELTAEYSKYFGEDFFMTLRGNFTFARNKIIENKQYYKNPWQDARGKRYGEYLMYDAMHLFTQEEIDALPDTYSQVGYAKDQLKPGDIRYRDVNDDGVITEDDQVFVGAVNTPEVMYGFGATLAYKKWDFSFLCQGAAGAYRSLDPWTIMPFQSERDPKNIGNILVNFADRFNEDNPDLYAFSPRFVVGPNQNTQASTWWIRKADYLRVKNIELGYTFEKTTLNRKLGMQKARVYINTTNPFTFSKFAADFWDPEAYINSYPLQTTIFIGLNVSF